MEQKIVILRKKRLKCKTSDFFKKLSWENFF
jgi:hypothetical protein